MKTLHRLFSLFATLLVLQAFPLLLLAADTAVTDSQVIESGIQLVGMFGLGLPGYAVAAAALAFLMKLSKWGRTWSVFHSVPKTWRSAIPIGLGVALGTVDSLARGEPLAVGLANGIAVGGGQQVLYEQVKGNVIGAVVDRATSWMPQPKAAR